MKMLPNGNIEITVELMPEAYAALMSAKERDKGSVADTVNLALMSHNMMSEMVTKAGSPLSVAMEEPKTGTTP